LEKQNNGLTMTNKTYIHWSTIPYFIYICVPIMVIGDTLVTCR